MDLKKLRQQLDEFKPVKLVDGKQVELDKTKDRAQLSTFNSFKKQTFSKIDMIDDLQKKQDRFGRDIVEYLGHLKKSGFQFTKFERESDARTTKAPVKTKPDVPENLEGDENTGGDI